MNSDFDASDANRETQNGLSSITGFPRQPDTRNLDMFADVAVARRQREKEGFNSDAAGIREWGGSIWGTFRFSPMRHFRIFLCGTFRFPYEALSEIPREKKCARMQKKVLRHRLFSA